jgi:hypothetical protein
MVIVDFGQFFDNYISSPHLGLLVHGGGNALMLAKNGFGYILRVVVAASLTRLGEISPSLIKD